MSPRLPSLERNLDRLIDAENVLERRIEKGEALLERLRWELRDVKDQIVQVEDQIRYARYYKTPTPKANSKEAREGITFGGKQKKNKKK